MCKKGYEGDGYVCDKIDPCMMDNGGCHELVRHGNNLRHPSQFNTFQMSCPLAPPDNSHNKWGDTNHSTAQKANNWNLVWH